MSSTQKPPSPYDGILPAGPDHWKRDLEALLNALKSVALPTEEHSLETAFRLCGEDPSKSIQHAFDAIELLAEKFYEHDGKAELPHAQLTRGIFVPYWALYLIARRWRLYQTNRAREPENAPTLGQTFGIEAEGRGGHNSLSKSRTQASHRELALAVEQKRKQREVTKDQAVQEVATEYGVQESKVERAHKQYGREAKERLTMTS